MGARSRTVVVTGVSTGIGWATAKVLVANGMTVFGSVRKQADADNLKREFGDRFIPLIFDVTDEAAVAAAAAQVREAIAGNKLGGLVNNAGIAVGGPLLQLPVSDFRRQLEVNLTGVLISTQAFAPLLGAEAGLQGAPGRIVNMGSIGGSHAFPFMGPYHTTKYGIEGFTESLRRELMPFGIDAILVKPGSVDTPIWDKADDEGLIPADGVYREPMQKFRDDMLRIGHDGIAPERIGETVLKALTDKHPKVRYVTTGRPIEFQALTRLPKRWVDNAIAGRLGLKRADA